jgi:hypothetical protein
MDLRPFAAFLLGTALEPTVEFFISFRSPGLCTSKILVEEYNVRPALIRFPVCPSLGLPAYL